MNNIFKTFDQPSVKEAVNDVIEALVVERLKEDYLVCLDFDDVETSAAILTVIRYFSTYDDFKFFLDEVRHAGYNVTREY